MSAKEIWTAGLMLVSAVCVVTGAILIQPGVIGVGLVAILAAAAVRVADRRSAANRIANGAAGAGK